MFKTLSKSVGIMFIFDLLILLFSTSIWAYTFNYSVKAVVFLTLSVVAVGLVVLFLKGNYKIREFNLTGKNTYLLFEGIVMMHIIPTLYLFIFASPIITTLKFLLVNILTIFVFLRLYRALFHFYLFKLKKTKNILILGTDERARVIADEINNKYALKMKVVGFVESDDCTEEFIADKKLPIVGQPKRELSDTKCEYFNFAFS